MTATIRYLAGQSFTVSLNVDEKDLTMRQWMIRHANEFRPHAITSGGTSFIFQLSKAGPGPSTGAINAFDQRHRRVSDMMHDGDTLIAYDWSLGGTIGRACTGNLIADQRTETDDECSMCLDDFTTNTKARWTRLDACGHRFHLHCLVQLKQLQCPCCSKALTSVDGALVRPPNCTCCRCQCNECMPLARHSARLAAKRPKVE